MNSTGNVTIILKQLFKTLFGAMHAACGILVPWPGIEPVPPALEAES